jgi:hypothetical protein
MLSKSESAIDNNLFKKKVMIENRKKGIYYPEDKIKTRWQFGVTL